MAATSPGRDTTKRRAARRKREARGRRIARARAACGLSIAKVAARIDVDPKTLWRWEQGLVESRSDKLVALADTLAVSLRWIMTGAEENAA